MDVDAYLLGRNLVPDTNSGLKGVGPLKHRDASPLGITCYRTDRWRGWT